MKLKQAIKVAAGLATVAVATTATAFDSTPLSGGASTEIHAYDFKVTECLAGCVATGGNDYELMSSYILPNPSPATGAFTEPQVVDTLEGSFDASGNLVVVQGPAGQFPTSGTASSYFPAFAFTSVTGGSSALRWDVTTAPNGKIIDGWVLYNSLYGGTNFTVIDFLATGESCTYSGADPYAFVPDDHCGPSDGWNTPLSPLPTGAAKDAFGTIAYLTCDVDFECGQFGKSVPVPAFAAAALGLGLFGITYLSGRRSKNIK